VVLRISVDTATQMSDMRFNNNVRIPSTVGRSLASEIHRQQIHSSIPASYKHTIWEPAQNIIYFEGNISVIQFFVVFALHRVTLNLVGWLN